MKMRMIIDIDDIDYPGLIRLLLPHVKKSDIPLPEKVIDAAATPGVLENFLKFIPRSTQDDSHEACQQEQHPYHKARRSARRASRCEYGDIGYKARHQKRARRETLRRITSVLIITRIIKAQGTSPVLILYLSVFSQYTMPRPTVDI